MACYLAVEAICGVPIDVKTVEPDLNYEIEELAIPKAQPEQDRFFENFDLIYSVSKAGREAKLKKN